jgi:hypothetical protein
MASGSVIIQGNPFMTLVEYPGLLFSEMENDVVLDLKIKFFLYLTLSLVFILNIFIHK